MPPSISACHRCRWLRGERGGGEKRQHGGENLLDHGATSVVAESPAGSTGGKALNGSR
jgi:hypothetical protein